MSSGCLTKERADKIKHDAFAILSPIREKLIRYIIDNKLTDDESLFLEAMIYRIIEITIDVADTIKKFKSRPCPGCKDRKTDGKTAKDIAIDLNGIFDDVKKNIRKYIDENDMDESEMLIFIAALQRTVADFATDAYTEMDFGTPMKYEHEW